MAVGSQHQAYRPAHPSKPIPEADLEPAAGAIPGGFGGWPPARLPAVASGLGPTGAAGAPVLE